MRSSSASTGPIPSVAVFRTMRTGKSRGDVAKPELGPGNAGRCISFCAIVTGGGGPRLEAHASGRVVYFYDRIPPKREAFQRSGRSGPAMVLQMLRATPFESRREVADARAVGRGTNSQSRLEPRARRILCPYTRVRSPRGSLLSRKSSIRRAPTLGMWSVYSRSLTSLRSLIGRS